MLGLSWGELTLVGIILFLVFGWAWVPRIGQGLGTLLDPPKPKKD